MTSPSIYAWAHQKGAKIIKHKSHKKQNQPYPSTTIKYGTKKQYVTPQSTSTLLDKKGKKFIEQMYGKFLFLGQTVNNTLLCLSVQ